MRPASGALRAQHDSCDGPAPACHEGIEPLCRRPRGTPTTSFDCWGSPCTDSLDCRHKPPPSGSPRRFGGVSWNASGPTCTRNFEDPMRHRSCGSFGQGPAFQVCFASAAARADTHTSRRCGVSPEIPRTPIHTIRSAVRRSEHPSCSPLAIAARSCTVNIRRTNNPSPTSTVATTL